jgi:hypothetical protein
MTLLVSLLLSIFWWLCLFLRILLLSDDCAFSHLLLYFSSLAFFGFKLFPHFLLFRS